MLRHGLCKPVYRAGIRTRHLHTTVTRLAADDTETRPEAPHLALRGFPRPKQQENRGAGLFNKMHPNIGIHHFTLVAVAENASRNWRLVRALANAPAQTYLLTKTLFECRVPMAEYERYKHVVVALSFSEAIRLCETTPPKWLIWHIFANKTASLEEALQAAGLIAQSGTSLQLEQRPEILAGCMVLTTHALARHNAAAAALPLITTYIERRGLLANPDLAFYSNSMLVALSRFPPSAVLLPLMRHFVRDMIASSIPFSDSMLEHLLASKSSTLERMRQVHGIIQAGHPSEVDRLVVQDYINVLQKEGAPGSVAQVLIAIIAPWDPVNTDESDDPPTVNGASTVSGTPTSNVPPISNDTPTSNDTLTVKDTSTLDVTRTLEDTPTFPPHFPADAPPKQYEEMTVFEWISYISQVARDPNVSGDVLVELYQFCQAFVARAARQEGSASISVRRKLLPAILSGLARRSETTRAVDIWNDYVARHLNPASGTEYLKIDRYILAAGINALAKAGLLSEAFATLDALALRLGEGGYAGGRSPYEFPVFDEGDATPRPRVPLVPVGLNALLDALVVHRRPDVVFAIWDMMEPAWGITPDNRTLDALLLSAAIAARIHATAPVREEIEYIRFRMRALLMPWRRPLAPDAVAPRGSRYDPALLVRRMLQSSGPQSTLWRGVPAWQRARYVFRTVVLGNWPELEWIVPPAVAIREGDPIDLAFADVDPSAWQAEPSSAIPSDNDLAEDTQEELEPGPQSPIPAGPSAATSRRRGEMPLERLRYPTTIPSHESFHIYISMLGQCGLASEIALALAWMRALHLVPKNETVALALVYWRTVTDDAPSVEIYKELVSRRRQKNDNQDATAPDPAFGSGYVDLVRWLNDWVPKRMPTDEQLRTLDHYTRSIITPDRDGGAIQ